MGRKSPLHDRQTTTLETTPFDYLESSSFFPDYSNEDKLIAYGILGGIPRYLEAFDANKSIKENIASKIIRNKSNKKAIFIECKFTSKPMPYEEYSDLVTATKHFQISRKYTYIL